MGDETQAEPLSKRLAKARKVRPDKDQGAQRKELYHSRQLATSEKLTTPSWFTVGTRFNRQMGHYVSPHVANRALAGITG